MSAHTASSLAAEIRNISGVLHDMKDEASRFVQTRFGLLKAELQEKLPTLKIAAILAALGAVLLATAYLLLTEALVAFVAILFKDSTYSWVFAFLSVGLLWVLLGGIALFFARREFALKGIMPRRTVEVLKADKIWLETEAKSQV